MRIVVMGTGGFAVPSFRSLLKSDHEIVALVTRPDKTVHRRKSTAPPNPMREVALAAGLPVLQPESIKSEEAVSDLQRLEPELLFVCDYGQILSTAALETARLGGINLHGSLLPKYRGAAPINWAIYHGEIEMGVTVIHMTPRLDAGPCLVAQSLKFEPKHDAVDVETMLSEVGVEATHEAIQMLAGWDEQETLGVIQDQSQATKAPRLKKSDGQIDWTRKAVEILNQVRAFKPWPGTFSAWQRNEKNEVRLLINQVEIEESNQCTPGQVISADKDGLVIACGENAIRIVSIQPAGKKRDDSRRIYSRLSDAARRPIVGPVASHRVKILHVADVARLRKRKRKGKEKGGCRSVFSRSSYEKRKERCPQGQSLAVPCC